MRHFLSLSVSISFHFYLSNRPISCSRIKENCMHTYTIRQHVESERNDERKAKCHTNSEPKQFIQLILYYIFLLARSMLNTLLFDSITKASLVESRKSILFRSFSLFSPFCLLRSFSHIRWVYAFRNRFL